VIDFFLVYEKPSVMLGLIDRVYQVGLADDRNYAFFHQMSSLLLSCCFTLDDLKWWQANYLSRKEDYFKFS